MSLAVVMPPSIEGEEAKKAAAKVQASAQPKSEAAPPPNAAPAPAPASATAVAPAPAQPPQQAQTTATPSQQPPSVASPPAAQTPPPQPQPTPVTAPAKTRVAPAPATTASSSSATEPPPPSAGGGTPAPAQALPAAPGPALPPGGKTPLSSQPPPPASTATAASGPPPSLPQNSSNIPPQNTVPGQKPTEQIRPALIPVKPPVVVAAPSQTEEVRPALLPTEAGATPGTGQLEQVRPALLPTEAGAAPPPVAPGAATPGQPPVQPDPERARQAAIADNLKQQEQRGRQRQDQLRGQGAELASKQAQQQALLQPSQQRLETARQADAALAKAPVRYEQRPEGLVSIQTNGTGAEKVQPVDPADTQEMQKGQSWLQQRDSAKAELAAAEAAHAPLAAGVQGLKDQRQKLAQNLMEENRQAQALQQRMQHEVSGQKGPPPAFSPAAADRQLLARMEAEGDPLAPAMKEAMTPPTIREFGDKLAQATPGVPMTMLDVATGGTPGSGAKASAKDAMAARDLTMKSMGVVDPKNVTFTPLPDGTQALHRPRSGSKKQWEEGKFSFQQSLALNAYFNGVVEQNTTQYGTQTALGEWAADPKNTEMGPWFQEGTPEQRAYAANQYFKQTAHRAEGSLLATPGRTEELRLSVLGSINPEWGKPGAASPGSAAEDGPAGMDQIPLKAGGSAFIPSGKWTPHDYETLDQNPAILKIPHAERQQAADTLLSDYHDKLAARPGFSAADQRQFTKTAQEVRDRVAALKTWGDTAGEGKDLVKGAVESEVGTTVAMGADLSAKNPDGSWRVPGRNMVEHGGHQLQKIKDTAQRLANPTAEGKIDDALEAIHQDVRNANFPVGDPKAQDKWIDELSASFNPQRQQWFDAVQGPADPNTPEGKKQVSHTQEKTLASEENRALLQEYIRTGNEDRWKELVENLKKTPQRVQTEEDQDKSLNNDPIVGFLNESTGTDFREHMKGAPGAFVGHFVPGIDKVGKIGKLGKGGGRVGKYAGKAARIGADIGNTVVQNTIENPESDFEDHKQSIIQDYTTSLGMKPLEHGADKVAQKVGSHLPRRPGAGSHTAPNSPDGAPPPPGSQSFDAGIAAETGVRFTAGDNPQQIEPDAFGQIPHPEIGFVTPTAGQAGSSAPAGQPAPVGQPVPGTDPAASGPVPPGPANGGSGGQLPPASPASPQSQIPDNTTDGAAASDGQPAPDKRARTLPSETENHEALTNAARLTEKQKTGELTLDEQRELDRHEKTIATSRQHHLETKQKVLSGLTPPGELDAEEAKALAEAKATLAKPVPGEPPAPSTNDEAPAIPPSGADSANVPPASGDASSPPDDSALPAGPTSDPTSSPAADDSQPTASPPAPSPESTQNVEQAKEVIRKAEEMAAQGPIPDDIRANLEQAKKVVATDTVQRLRSIQEPLSNDQRQELAAAQATLAKAGQGSAKNAMFDAVPWHEKTDEMRQADVDFLRRNAVPRRQAPSKNILINRMGFSNSLAAQKAALLMDSVHDGVGLGSVNVGFHAPTDSRAAGQYVPADPARGIHAPRIMVSDLTRTPVMTTLHEYGHHLEEHLSRDDVAAVVRAARNSFAADRVADDPKNAEYLLRSDELFARAYAQFIAQTSGDADCQRELNSVRDGVDGHRYWDRKDFEPIEDAIRMALKRKGW